MSDRNARSYWKANLKIVGTLLCVWFFISFVCGILLADYLDNFRIGGFKLGVLDGAAGFRSMALSFSSLSTSARWTSSTVSTIWTRSARPMGRAAAQPAAEQETRS